MMKENACLYSYINKANVLVCDEWWNDAASGDESPFDQICFWRWTRMDMNLKLDSDREANQAMVKKQLHPPVP